jgi:hypothetical protein
MIQTTVFVDEARHGSDVVKRRGQEMALRDWILDST